jgi:oxygen-independent coproporphyrinogen-3 oxidase
VPNISLYVHWPFCKSKCPYCDFNSHVSQKIDYDLWLKSYLIELRSFASLLAGKNLVSVFFGGGTPSLMPPKIAASIIEELNVLCNVTDATEITLEANPTSVEASKFRDFKTAGINRVSLGIQALNNEDLIFLGREHNFTEAMQALELASKYFHRYSFDLIYARPNQTLRQWEAELTQALRLTDGHISLYQLTIEKGTKFYNQYRKQEFALPQEELAEEMYILTQELTEQYGMPAYEVSNHARVGAECKHNMVYWNYGDYLGIGPGAHSRLEGRAIMMCYNPGQWLEKVNATGHGIQQESSLSQQEILEELLLMGLRVSEGISQQNFFKRTGDVPEKLLNLANLKFLIAEGLVIQNPYAIKVTKKGRLVLNKIIEMLLQTNTSD